MKDVTIVREAGSPGRKRQTGQSLAEFAITLPILLLLLFGIIEFGRIFQAWVTLQNSARAAIRQITTGAYDTRTYTLNLEFIYDEDAGAGQGDLNSIVPCEYTDPTAANADALIAAQRGTKTSVDIAEDNIEIYVGGSESLYATWYNGDDCDPSDPEDQNRRKDMARILTAYDEARTGAAGLALNDDSWGRPEVGNRATSSYPLTDVSEVANTPWFRAWYRTLPGTDTNGDGIPEYTRPVGSDQRGWFDVVICSDRPQYEFESGWELVGTYPNLDENERTTAEELMAGPNPRTPICELRSQAPSVTGSPYLRNAGTPWLDAGGPGDQVWVVVTFNHPLITPIQVAPFLPLQARRTGINETFRNPRPVGLEGNEPDVPPVGPEVSDEPDPDPFVCSDIQIVDLEFVGSSARFSISNASLRDATLMRVNFVWPDTMGAYGGVTLDTFSLNTLPLWDGDGVTPPSDVGFGAPRPFTNPENTVIAGPSNTFTALFSYPPVDIGLITYKAAFNGTTFYIDDPNNADPTVMCDVSWYFEPPTPTFTPSATFTPRNTFTPSPTFTASNTFTPTFTATHTFTFTPTFTASNTYTFTPTFTPTNTSTYTSTFTPTFTASNTFTHTPSNTPTYTFTASNTATYTSTFTPTFTASNTATFTPSNTATRTFTPSNTSTRTPSNTPSNTATRTPTFTPSNTFTPSRTPSNTPTRTPSRTPSNTPTRTPTFTPSNTFTPTRTFTPSNTATRTFTPSNTSTRTPSFTPSNTSTRTPSFTPSNTATRTPTFTPSNTATNTRTFTPTSTSTPSFTPSNTATRTPTFTPSNTASNTPTRTFTPTPSNTATRTFTPTFTNTPTRTPTFTPSNTPSNTPTRTPSSTFTNTPLPPILSITPDCNASGQATFRISNTGGSATGTLTYTIRVGATVVQTGPVGPIAAGGQVTVTVSPTLPDTLYIISIAGYSFPSYQDRVSCIGEGGGGEG